MKAAPNEIAQKAEELLEKQDSGGNRFIKQHAINFEVAEI